MVPWPRQLLWSLFEGHRQFPAPSHQISLRSAQSKGPWSLGFGLQHPSHARPHEGGRGFSRPSLQTDLQWLLGLVNFYGHSLKGADSFLLPLIDALKGGPTGALVWMLPMEQAFLEAKTELALLLSANILRRTSQSPSWSMPPPHTLEQSCSTFAVRNGPRSPSFSTSWCWQWATTVPSTGSCWQPRQPSGTSGWCLRDRTSSSSPTTSLCAHAVLFVTCYSSTAPLHLEAFAHPVCKFTTTEPATPSFD